MPRIKSSFAAALALAGALTLIECSETKPAATGPERSQASAMFGGRPIEGVPFAELAAYERSLTFDAAKPGADVATIRTEKGETITVEAEPATDASTMSDEARVAGRIIARVHSSAAYAPLGLAAGVTYFWEEGTGERARAVMISADGSSRVVRPLILRQHAYGTAVRPTVRFISVPGMGDGIPLINGRCTGWCCSVGIPHIPTGQMPLVDAALLQMHKRIAAGL